MRIFKIVLGITIVLLGLGMAAAGFAMFFYGNLGTLFNIFFGCIFIYLGIGLVFIGSLLTRGGRVRDALGGIITSRTGHSGINLRPDEYHDYPVSGLKDTLMNILLYTVVGIAVVLIALFSVFRVTGGVQSWIK